MQVYNLRANRPELEGEVLDKPQLSHPEIKLFENYFIFRGTVHNLSSILKMTCFVKSYFTVLLI